MKMFQITNAIPAFAKLAEADMEMREAYSLQKLMASLQVEIDFFNTQKLKIAEKYGTINADDTVDIPKEKIPEAQAALDELTGMDVTAVFDVIKIHVSDNIKISANDIAALTPFIEFIMEGK